MRPAQTTSLLDRAKSLLRAALAAPGRAKRPPPPPHDDFGGLSSTEVFTKVYATRTWGTDAEPGSRFYSGGGSRDEAVVGPYVSAVTAFIASLERRPDLVDLGCGDFAVGARIRPACARYVACDVVAALVEDLARRYPDLDVRFVTCDIARDDLPDGDVATLRQVLQHLSNADIAEVLPKVAERYRYLILTEHLPHGAFVPNLDMPTGPGIRVHRCDPPSGVVVTEPPFGLPAEARRELCRVEQPDGVIVTTLYTLRS